MSQYTLESSSLIFGNVAVHRTHAQVHCTPEGHKRVLAQQHPGALRGANITKGTPGSPKSDTEQ